MTEIGATYEKSGVSIKAADRFTEMIKERVANDWPDAGKEIGGFAGGGPIPTGAKRFVASTDGTGTKAIIAALVNKFDGLGQDAVAMGAVDTYVAGYQPAYLLDTLDVAKLNPDLHIKIIDSVIAACKLAGCRLIGGETAELPDMFKHSWMVNLNVSVIGFPQTISDLKVRAGQKVYGWLSYGVASNGFSLVRNVFRLKDKPSRARQRLNRRFKELGNKTLADALLRATPIWIPAIEQELNRGVRFAAHAHITGGGMPGNIPRILPDNLKVIIDRSTWERPAIFKLIEEVGNVSQQEMDRTFNQGIMIASIVWDECKLPAIGFGCFIGYVEKRKENESQVQFIGSHQESY